MEYFINSNFEFLIKCCIHCLSELIFFSVFISICCYLILQEVFPFCLCLIYLNKYIYHPLNPRKHYLKIMLSCDANLYGLAQEFSKVENFVLILSFL